MSVGTLRSKLPTDHFPSVIQSVTTDGKVSELKKKSWVADVEVLAGYFFRQTHRQIQNNSPYSDVTGLPFKLPTESPRDLKWQIRTVTCLCVRQNHRRSVRRWNRRKKLIYVHVSSADPLLPYFSFFFLIPTLSICKQLRISFIIVWATRPSLFHLA